MIGELKCEVVSPSCAVWRGCLLKLEDRITDHAGPGEVGRETGEDAAKPKIVGNRGSWDARETNVVDAVSITAQVFFDSGVFLDATVVGIWQRAIVFGENWMREQEGQHTRQSTPAEGGKVTKRH